MTALGRTVAALGSSSVAPRPVAVWYVVGYGLGGRAVVRVRVRSHRIQDPWVPPEGTTGDWPMARLAEHGARSAAMYVHVL